MYEYLSGGKKKKFGRWEKKAQTFLDLELRIEYLTLIITPNIDLKTP